LPRLFISHSSKDNVEALAFRRWLAANGWAEIVRYADRQLVDLSQEPTERIEPFEHEGKLHRVEFSIAALASIKGRLAYLGIAPGSFAWEPHKLPDGKELFNRRLEGRRAIGNP
jgi:hypothetical protein